MTKEARGTAWAKVVKDQEKTGVFVVWSPEDTKALRELLEIARQQGKM